MRRAREALGLTQVEFADLLGKNKYTVWNWENGCPFPEAARRHIQMVLRLKRISIK